MLRKLLTILAVLLSAIACVAGSAAAAHGPTYGYDSPTIARVDVHQIVGAEAGQSQFGDGRNGSASTPTEGQAASATPVSLGVATEAVNVIPSSGKTHVVTPRGTVYDVPEGWTHRVADNGKGSVYQKPGSTGNKDMVRIMEPTPKYPDGYARVHNGQAPNGQPVDVFGKPGPQPATHIPETYVGPWPGWPS